MHLRSVLSSPGSNPLAQVGFYRTNLVFTIVRKQSGRTLHGDRPLPLEGLADFVRRQRAGASGIVYALTRDDTTQAADYLVPPPLRRPRRRLCLSPVKIR